MGRERELAAYLQEVSLETDFWGRSNCMLFAGRWVAIARPDYDPSRWIGAHSDMASAARDLRAAGGALALFEAEAARAGLIEVDPADAELGDVGLYRISDIETKLGIVVTEERASRTIYPAAIRTSRHWAVRGADGVGRILADGRRDPFKAWRV